MKNKKHCWVNGEWYSLNLRMSGILKTKLKTTPLFLKT